MYRLNNRDELFSDDLTIAKVIEQKKFSYKKKIVTINGEFIEPVDYDKTPINKGDDVKIHHLLAGG